MSTDSSTVPWDALRILILPVGEVRTRASPAEVWPGFNCTFAVAGRPASLRQATTLPVRAERTCRFTSAAVMCPSGTPPGR